MTTHGLSSQGAAPTQRAAVSSAHRYAVVEPDSLYTRKLSGSGVSAAVKLQLVRFTSAMACLELPEPAARPHKVPNDSRN